MRRRTAEKPEWHKSIYVFRKCGFAALRDLRHSLALLAAFIVISVGAGVFLVAPSLPITHIPLVALLAFWYLGGPFWFAANFYLRIRDVRDERYELTEDGKLRFTYRTLGVFESTPEGPIDRVDGGKFVRQGFLEYFFNFGDVILQVGWDRSKYIMKDVYRPARVLRIVMDEAKKAQQGERTMEPESALEILRRRLARLTE